MKLSSHSTMDHNSFFIFHFCRKAAVCPIIDVIDDNSFAYISGSDMTWGGFNWRLNFRWYSVPQRENDRRNGDRSIPLRCACTLLYRDYIYPILFELQDMLTKAQQRRSQKSNVICHLPVLLRKTPGMKLLPIFKLGT